MVKHTVHLARDNSARGTALPGGESCPATTANFKTPGRSPLPLLCVIVPTYNHGPTVSQVLDAIAALALPLVVVNDGSTDDTANLLETWMTQHPHAPAILRTHAANKGKAAALRTGFDAAAQAGFTHAATIDADGQLEPSDIPSLFEVAKDNPDALILGQRPTDMAQCPTRCLVGRSFASLGVLAQCGLHLDDTQCGLRIYPLKLVQRVACRAGRFSFEAEMIVRAAWAGFGVVPAPVRCVYFEGARRVSHYRPWSDSLRQCGMHFRLLTIAMLAWPHPRLTDAPPSKARGLLPRLANWLSPARCVRETRADLLGTIALCTSIAFGAWAGLWFGLLPLPFLWIPGAIYIAWRMHMQPLPALAAAATATYVGARLTGVPPLGLLWPAWLTIGGPLGLCIAVFLVFWPVLGLAMLIRGNSLKKQRASQPAYSPLSKEAAR